MKIKVFLIIRNGEEVRVVRKLPYLEPNEVAVEININAPQPPRIVARVEVELPEPPPAYATIEAINYPEDPTE